RLKLGVEAGLARRDEDQVGFESVDALPVGLLEAADVGVTGVVILAEVGRDQGLGKADHLDAQRVQGVQGAKVKDDDPLRLLLQLGFAQRMGDGHGIGSKSRLGYAKSQDEGDKQQRNELAWCRS